uniref:PGG domain-containing protein n=1 Tax=Oryza glaberrima TaxID=4538 RepID=I1QN04_ORYGL
RGRYPQYLSSTVKALQSIIIYEALLIADAPSNTGDDVPLDGRDGRDGPDRSDRIDKRKIHELRTSKEDKVSQNITTGTQVIGIVSVLVAAVAFAAAFALPGGLLFMGM